MATETQIEVAKDPTGLITRTVTKQAFAWEDPDGTARSYRVSQSDGVTTIVEEFFDDMPPVFSVDISCTTEPLDSHPFYSNLTATERSNWTIWKSNPSLTPNPALTPPEWNPVTNGGQSIQDLYYFWAKGVTTYFAPRMVVKCQTLETGAPDAAGVGQISNPGYPGNEGNVNFILTGISAQQEGNNYRVSREYLASPQGTQWDPDIYA